MKWFIFERNWFKISTLSRNNQWGISLCESGSRSSLWISTLLTHSLKYKVPMIKCCSFKMITFCSFQVPCILYFDTGMLERFWRKAHKYSVSWQQIRYFKVSLVITLVLKKWSSTFGKYQKYILRCCGVLDTPLLLYFL